ncbi:MAG: 3-deoxy-7-phosphoheptulonate synthase [Candidatus Tectomicrobia bacterium]|uniref:3-deoxy-7-phosphoheptulonate synthase n=1 Tax=Tectimicrobiota bacterium TaxID=2528274 RepID=A0A932CQG7_UNCTE|nr:3-deoxy-7-phosphoheptulonate synthase [Candidatus Tectomicrobia bacterium]
MIIVLKPDATQENLDQIVDKLKSLGLSIHLSKGAMRTIVGAIGDEAVLQSQPLEVFPGVEKVIPILQPFKLASREFRSEDSILNINGHEIGGEQFHVIAGPCAVENQALLLEIAWRVKESGATFLRGGAFKPRTSPYTFQGLGEKGLEYLARAREETGLLIVTELMDPRDMELVGRYADVIQIGARNMQNFGLLKEVGSQSKPVVLKRGMSATIKDLLMSAEYILAQGNHQVMLCERGIRTFETATRNTLDLSAIPVIQELSHLPVIVDPSHGVGKWEYVAPMSKAAVAAGADGLLIEVHPYPEKALSDGPQSLLPSKFHELMKDLAQIARSIGRRL